MINGQQNIKHRMCFVLSLQLLFEIFTILRRIQLDIIITVYLSSCGPGSSVGIATDYGLNGPEIESRWGRDFPHLSRPALGPTQPPVQSVPGLSRGRKRPGRDADLSPPIAVV
jgi:hypothetical protein